MDGQNQIDILLVDDDEGDVALTREGLESAKILIQLNTVDDGIKALQYLRKEPPYQDATRPEIILLDLNMPRKDGRETLKEIKADRNLRSIPVVVLTTSEAEIDIVKSYELGANCYITKPVGFAEFVEVVRSIEEFWFTIVKIPPKS